MSPLADPHWPTWGDKVLRRARDAQGLTREQVAERSGLAASTVRNLERGRLKFPESRTLRQVCGALGLPLPGDEGLYLSLHDIDADRLRQIVIAALSEYALRRRDVRRFVAACCPGTAASAIQRERDLAIRITDALRLPWDAPTIDPAPALGERTR